MDVASYYSTKCATCKFFEQGETCSYCGNPVQTDDSLREYCYYDFGCELHVKGIAQSRLEYMTRTGPFDYFNDVIEATEIRGWNAVKAVLIGFGIVGTAALLIMGAVWLTKHFA